MFYIACLSAAEMRLSAVVGYVAAAFGVAATLAALAMSIRHHNFTWMPFYAVLLAVHPAWTISVLRGDCGDARRFLSGAASFVFLALLLVQAVRPQFGRQRFLFALCALAWSLYLPLFFSLLFHAPLFLLSDSSIGHVLAAYTFSFRDIAHISVALTAACIAVWFSRRFYDSRAKV